MALLNPTVAWGFLLYSILQVPQCVGVEVERERSLDVASILRTLTSTNESLSVRVSAARSLEQSGISSGPATSTLVDIFIKKSEDQDLRLATGAALRSAPASDLSVPAFMVVLKDQKETLALRTAAFEGYWKQASNSTTFTADFIKILQDKNEDRFIREKAGQVLQGVVARYAGGSRGPVGTLREIEESAAKAHDMRTAFEISGLEIPAELTRAITLLDQRKEFLASRTSLASRIFSAPWVWFLFPAIPPLLCGPVWLLLLWRAPLKLWKAAAAIRVVPEFKFRVRIGVTLSLRKYLLLSFVEYHPRVLDAWLEQYWAQATRCFNGSPTIADRSLHIPAPALINQLAILRPAPADFKGLFEKPRVAIAICGASGLGKTSLACQLARWAMAEKAEDRIAKHRMLPILIAEEQELRSADGRIALLELISAKTRSLCNNTEELSAELLHHLLNQRRILVMADGLSEMSEAVLASFEFACDAASPINAWILTSRFKQWPNGLTPDVIETLDLQADAHSDFLSAFLTLRGKRSLFEDREILMGCVRLLDALGGRRPSALAARLFAELLIGSKESSSISVPLGNLTDLVLSYLADLNRGVAAVERLDDRLVNRLAKAAAWDSVQKNLWPATVERSDLLATLRKEGGEEKDLAYLEHQLHLLRTDGATSRVRFSIGALAEHLAASHLVESLGADEPAWRRLLEEVRQKTSKRQKIEFILTLRRCCLDREEPSGLPDFVEIELGKLAGLDSASLEQAQQQRKLDRLVRNLSNPDPQHRKTAVVKLASLGSASAPAVPALLAPLLDPHEKTEMRVAVAAALGEIGTETSEAITALLAVLRDGEAELQTVAARSLVRLGDQATAALIGVIHDPEAAESFKIIAVTTLASFDQDRLATLRSLIRILGDRQQSERVRAAAAEALGAFGAVAEIAATDLIDSMPESKILCQSAANALLGIAPGARPSILALVEALNPVNAPNSREILSSFRRTLIQPAHPRPSSTAGEASVRICRALEEALRNLRARRQADARIESSSAMTVVGRG